MLRSLYIGLSWDIKVAGRSLWRMSVEPERTKPESSLMAGRWRRRCLGRSGAVYGHTEIRNNCGGKQLAAKQVVKTSEARGRLAQGLAVKGCERREDGWGWFIGHLLACGPQIYKCWAEGERAGGEREGSAQPPRGCCTTPSGAVRGCQINTQTRTQTHTHAHGHTDSWRCRRRADFNRARIQNVKPPTSDLLTFIQSDSDMCTRNRSNWETNGKGDKGNTHTHLHRTKIRLWYTQCIKYTNLNL